MNRSARVLKRLGMVYLIHELWGIGLVRYESTCSFIGIRYELAEIIHVVKDREYNRMELAARIISRWQNMKPRGLPLEPAPTTDLLPNGRYQYYRWVPVPIHADGIPGFTVPGEQGGFKMVEHPYIHLMIDPRQLHVVGTRWPEDQVKWFDQVHWFSSIQKDLPKFQDFEDYHNSESSVELTSLSTETHYSARDYILDRKQMFKVLAESIDKGCIILYQSDTADSSYMGQVVEKRVKEAKHDRKQIEWDIIRLNDELFPIRMEGTEEPLLETVRPQLLLRVIWIPFWIERHGINDLFI